MRQIDIFLYYLYNNFTSIRQSVNLNLLNMLQYYKVLMYIYNK